jgi:hypothetical protein
MTQRAKKLDEISHKLVTLPTVFGRFLNGKQRPGPATIPLEEGLSRLKHSLSKLTNWLGQFGQSGCVRLGRTVLTFSAKKIGLEVEGRDTYTHSPCDNFWILPQNSSLLGRIHWHIGQRRNLVNRRSRVQTLAGQR